MAKETTALEIITHLLGLFTSFVGALIVLLASDDKKVKEHAKNALNWQISLIIYVIISAILIIILIGFLLLAILGILNLVFCIVAAVRASEGKAWKYPFTIQFLK